MTAGSGPARRLIVGAAEAMAADVLAGPAGIEARTYVGAASDSRQTGGGRLFFALRGERVDGFDFCGPAVAAGAAAVVVARDRGLPAGCESVPVLAVDDPRAALADLARAIRQAFAGKVVGITGSNGKTTTKELVAAALAGKRVLKTRGNLNSEIGLPLSVLESSGDEDYWVLEMAMRARGEIAFLAELARPHVGLVTNVAAAHIGRLGGIEEVARAKGEIFSGLAAGGIAVLPDNEPLLEAEAEHLPESRKRRFSGGHTGMPASRAGRADVRVLEMIGAGVRGSVVRLAVADVPVVVRLPLGGAHNAINAAAALTVVHALGEPVVPAAAGLEKVALPPHRSNLIALGGRTILDDCYNANPASMAAALTTLATSAGGAGRAFAVLGDMQELGAETEAQHRNIGRLCARLRLAGVVAIGELAPTVLAGAAEGGLPATATMVAPDPEAAAAWIAEHSTAGDWVLVKASRALALERVVAALKGRLRGASGPTDGPAPPQRT